jgi:hypothetical protein
MIEVLRDVVPAVQIDDIEDRIEANHKVLSLLNLTR